MSGQDSIELSLQSTEVSPKGLSGRPAYLDFGPFERCASRIPPG